MISFANDVNVTRRVNRFPDRAPAAVIGEMGTVGDRHGFRQKSRVGLARMNLEAATQMSTQRSLEAVAELRLVVSA